MTQPAQPDVSGVSHHGIWHSKDPLISVAHVPSLTHQHSTNTTDQASETWRKLWSQAGMSVPLPHVELIQAVQTEQCQVQRKYDSFE